MQSQSWECHIIFSEDRFPTLPTMRACNSSVLETAAKVAAVMPTAITAVKGRLACRLRAQIIIKPSSVWHWGDASQCCPELRFERVTVSRLLSAFIVCSTVRWFGFSDNHGQLQRRFRADKLRVLFRQAVLRFTPESVGGYRATWNWNRSSSSKILSGLMKIADRSWKVVTWD